MGDFNGMGAGGCFGGNIVREDGKFFGRLTVDPDTPIWMVTHFEHNKTIAAIFRNYNFCGISLAVDFFVADGG